MSLTANRKSRYLVPCNSNHSFPSRNDFPFSSFSPSPSASGDFSPVVSLFHSFNQNEPLKMSSFRLDHHEKIAEILITRWRFVYVDVSAICMTNGQPTESPSFRSLLCIFITWMAKWCHDVYNFSRDFQFWKWLGDLIWRRHVSNNCVFWKHVSTDLRCIHKWWKCHYFLNSITTQLTSSVEVNHKLFSWYIPF